MIVIDVSGDEQGTNYKPPLPVSDTRLRLMRYREHTRSSLKNYIDNLTVHGVTKIFTGSAVERFFWAVVFLGVFAFFLIILYSLFTQFNSHTYITNTQLLEVDQLKLPSITVCDQSSFECTSMLHRNGSFAPWCDQQQLKAYIKDFVKNTYCWNKTMVQDGCNYEPSPYHPGCIIINPSQNVTQDTPGRNSKLYFRFHTEIHSRTLYLFLHNRGEVPSFKDRFKYYIKSTGSYNVILSRTDTKRLPAPFYSNCTTPRLSTSQRFPYSRSLCQQVCIAKYMYDKCRAVGAQWYQYLPSNRNKQNAHYQNNTEVAVIRYCTFLVTFNSFNGPCKCAKPCQETVYEAHIKEISTNKRVYSLAFYFEKLEITSSSELPSYDRTRFLADIGGIVGLLVGMSLLSLFEVSICVVLFAVDLILMLTLKCY